VRAYGGATDGKWTALILWLRAFSLFGAQRRLLVSETPLFLKKTRKK
jgi:DNA polymerase III delta subunit